MFLKNAKYFESTFKDVFSKLKKNHETWTPTELFRGFSFKRFATILCNLSEPLVHKRYYDGYSWIYNITIFAFNASDDVTTAAKKLDESKPLPKFFIRDHMLKIED